jgi:hypothetical protein
MPDTENGERNRHTARTDARAKFQTHFQSATVATAPNGRRLSSSNDMRKPLGTGPSRQRPLSVKNILPK